MAVDDVEGQPEALIGLEHRPLVAVGDLDALLHAQEALGGALLLDAGLLQEKHERRGAAIHDGDFGAVEVDMAIVDSQAGERGHQVLDRVDLGLALDQAGAQPRLAHQVGPRRHVGRRREVETAKDDPGIGLRRPQREANLWPVCRPTPVALISDLRVRCRSMVREFTNWATRCRRGQRGAAASVRHRGRNEASAGGSGCHRIDRTKGEIHEQHRLHRRRSRHRHRHPLVLRIALNRFG